MLSLVLNQLECGWWFDAETQTYLVCNVIDWKATTSSYALLGTNNVKKGTYPTLKCSQYAPIMLMPISDKIYDGCPIERCNGNPHDHLMCKQCFRLSVSNSISDEEEKLVKDLMSKLNNLWPSQNEQRDYLYVQKTEPDCHPTKVHKDVTE